MTLSPAGAHLAPVDPPPPPPHQDPREPPSTTPRRSTGGSGAGGGTRTPSRPHSPVPSRGASPQRQSVSVSGSGFPSSPASGRNESSGHAQRMDRTASLDAIVSVPPLVAPNPKPFGALGGGGGGGSRSDSRDRLSPVPSGHASPSAGGTGGTHTPFGLGHGSPSHASTIQPISATAHHHHLSRPSSPSSINSSTSAIFERDIEHPAVGPLALATSASPAPTSTTGSNAGPGQTLTHKPSRLGFGFAHGSALDHTVPAVLDDAVEALSATSRGGMGIEGLEIEAPAPSGAGGVGMARVNSIPGLPTSGRKISSPAPQQPPISQTLSQQSLSLSRSTSPAASVASGRSFSSATTPAQSPPILSQLSGSGLGGGMANLSLGGGGASPTDTRPPAPAPTSGIVPSGPGASPPVGTAPTTQPLKDSTSTLNPPSRPAAMTRMSTGRQVPGGWMSSWTREEEELEVKNQVHPGEGEVGVGLERTQGILGEKEKVVPIEEVSPGTRYGG